MSMPLRDIAGERVGTLVAEAFIGQNRHWQRVWRWRCDCGGARDVMPSALRREFRNGGHASCGCLRPKKKRGRKPTKMAHRKIGLWKVLRRVKVSANRHAHWVCLCRGCNTEHEVRGTHLRTHSSLGCPSCTIKAALLATDGDRLRTWRLRARLTIRQAAKRVSFTHQRWFQYEQKKVISPEQFARLIRGDDERHT